MHYGIFSLTTVRMTVFCVLSMPHVFKYRRINVRKLDVHFCLFLYYSTLKTSTSFLGVDERKAKLQAVFLNESVGFCKNMHVMKGMPA